MTKYLKALLRFRRKANKIRTVKEMEEMTASELNRLISFLKDVKGWTDAEIVELLKYLSN